MKIIIIVILSLFCTSCSGQNTSNKKNDKSTIKEVMLLDTLSRLSLRNKQYNDANYKLLRLCNLDNDGYRIDSTKRIELSKDNKTIASILLPIADVDIANFSVNKIVETKRGFNIVVNWGGGNYFYRREFYFTFKGNQFYLDSIQMISYKQVPEKETYATKKITPPIPIRDFEILHYLHNE